MDFLQIFSLQDVFIAATGLMLVSILRIYYDSYLEKKKVKRFGQSLWIYNSLFENDQEGLLIISDNEQIIFANDQAAKILNTNVNSLDIDYIKSINIENEENKRTENLLKVIHNQKYIAHANIIYTSETLPVSISINQVKLSPQSYNYSYVVILRDNTSISDLRNKAADLIE